ncbi:MAG: MlaD family protein [Thermoleophilaceae bacterium]|jgi:phospholipid/cholesterol/gamma-HCH transport system substrate-binding protein
MIKQAPSVGRILVMVAFALSCVGILLFLWLSFGGAVPLKPKGYRVQIKFPEATQLAQEADVRISGVNVGKVVRKDQDRKTGLTDATLELDSQYSPIPEDTRAILRQKTLLGETYVELTPGDKHGQKLKDGGTLPEGQVSPTVELDEIFRTFDPKTRNAFRVWLSEQGRALSRRGEDLNNALAQLEPFAQDTDEVLKVVRRQSGATRALVRNTGEVFTALSERRGQLRGLISNSNRVFETTARRDAELADAIRVFPTFLVETRNTTRRVSRFADATNPLITQLRPAARELSPTLIDLAAIAPDLRGLFKDIGPLVKVSRRGLPAIKTTLKQTQGLLSVTPLWTREVVPILDYLGLYKHELASFFANDVASTQAVDVTTTPALHYLRTTNPVNPEVLAGYPHRLPTNRSNPYVEPGGYSRLRSGLQLFGSYLCPAGRSPAPPAVGPNLSASLASLIQTFVFAAGGAPKCSAQRPLGRLVNQSGLYPHLQQVPLPTSP